MRRLIRRTKTPCGVSESFVFFLGAIGRFFFY